MLSLTSYGTPSLKVRRRLLARHRPEDDSVVLPGIPVEERGHLIEVMPDAFFCEPHYEGYDIVLAWLPPAPPDIIGRFLERRWRSAATKRALASFDA
ncbi:MAG: MmcQ/YjbR family DNA-binding protein [Pseudomonadota bacterium]